MNDGYDFPVFYGESIVQLVVQAQRDWAAIDQLLRETVPSDRRSWMLRLYAKLFLQQAKAA